MTEKISSIHSIRSTYPLAVSLSMIIVAILLSFVDLAFLNDVIGKVLDLGTVESMAIAFALGLIGIAIMAHLGIKEAHESMKFGKVLAHYMLWLSLGLALVLIRLFSASIMQLDNSLGDESLFSFYSVSIREVDLILAPLMFFLYIATGVLAKDGFKNLLLNPGFEIWWAAWKESRINKRNQEEERRAKAERKRTKQLEDAERKQKQREQEIQEARMKTALHGNYNVALSEYRAKEKEIKNKYQKISANIDYIKNIDKQEKDFETKVKPSLLKIVYESISSAQNNVALAIRKQTDESIINLRRAIDTYNNDHDENSR